MARRSSNAEAQKIKAWSYSRWTTYGQCPARAKFKFLDLLKEPSGPALHRGSRIHELAEQFVKGHLKELPDELKQFKEEFLELATNDQIEVDPESKWCFDDDFNPLDDFFHDGAWLRMVVDCAAWVEDTKTLTIIDYKTGKVYPGNEAQLELYAMGGLIKYPQAEYVEPVLWYLDQGMIKPDDPVKYSQDDLEGLKEKWLVRTGAMLSDTKFRPTPGDACRWCHFSNSKGGPCTY